jgi:hypothetical protein
MEIIIGDKKYNSWTEPSFSKKRSKKQTTTLSIYDKFEGDISDIIIIKKRYYQWILKGCSLIRKEEVNNLQLFFPSLSRNLTKLTISFDERCGSHLGDFIKSEIRDYLLDKVFKAD